MEEYQGRSSHKFDALVLEITLQTYKMLVYKLNNHNVISFYVEKKNNGIL